MYKENLSFDQVVKLYQKNEDIDILRLSLAIGVSRLTDSQRVLTCIYAFIFGFFFSRNFWFVLDRLKGKIKGITILLLTAFFFVNPIWNINGFRFYTAANIFIYGLLPYLFEGKKKGLIICSLSFLVHFSFLIPISVLLIFVLLGNRTLVYFIFFLGSIVTSEINIKSINGFIEANAPKALSERTETYRSDQQVKDFRKAAGGFDESKVSFHAKFYLKALNWSLMAILIFLFFRRKILKQLNPKLLYALSFIFLFWGIANFLSSLPSGGRFLTIACLSALPLIIFYVHYMYNDLFLLKLTRIAAPALALFILVSVRLGFYSLTLNTFISNPVISLFSDYSFSLNDLIK